MITEDYVSFEIAKLLKEKGFKEWCRCCYGVAVLHNGEDISFDEECDLKDEGRENEIEYVECGTKATSILEANGSNLPEALDYLEKQKDSKVVKFDHDREQKPAEEDKTNGWTGVDLERYLSCLQKLGTGNSQQPGTINSKWFKEHCRPQLKQEWSKEDKVMLDNLIWEVHMKSIKPLDEMDDRSKYKKYEDFLKSLPERFNPQPHWKPNEYTLSLVKKVADGEMLTGVEQMAMGTLEEQLKKL